MLNGSQNALLACLCGETSQSSGIFHPSSQTSRLDHSFHWLATRPAQHSRAHLLPNSGSLNTAKAAHPSLSDEEVKPLNLFFRHSIGFDNPGASTESAQNPMLGTARLCRYFRCVAGVKDFMSAHHEAQREPLRAFSRAAGLGCVRPIDPLAAALRPAYHMCGAGRC